MGLTTTAVYITVVALIVPALVKIGVEPVAAHMFAFYFGLMSSITRPVALTTFAATAIARTGPMTTALESTRVGIAKYLVPLAFAYNAHCWWVRRGCPSCPPPSRSPGCGYCRAVSKAGSAAASPARDASRRSRPPR